MLLEDHQTSSRYALNNHKVNSYVKHKKYLQMMQLLYQVYQDNNNRQTLQTALIKNPTTTFWVKASGNSMINAGIQDGDLLIADKSIKPVDGQIVVANLYGNQFTVKRLKEEESGKILLVAENPEYPSLRLNRERISGHMAVVTNVIHAIH